jgi:hypothetical protein
VAKTKKHDEKFKTMGANIQTDKATLILIDVQRTYRHMNIKRLPVT